MKECIWDIYYWPICLTINRREFDAIAALILPVFFSLSKFCIVIGYLPLDLLLGCIVEENLFALPLLWSHRWLGGCLRSCDYPHELRSYQYSLSSSHARLLQVTLSWSSLWREHVNVSTEPLIMFVHFCFQDPVSCELLGLAFHHVISYDWKSDYPDRVNRVIAWRKRAASLWGIHLVCELLFLRRSEFIWTWSPGKHW